MKQNQHELRVVSRPTIVCIMHDSVLQRKEIVLSRTQTLITNSLLACILVITGIPLFIVLCLIMFHRYCILKKILFYLFLEKWKGREKERGRSISVWLPLVHLEPRHVP